MKIITGTPGTGKHTVAKILARSLGLELVDISRMAMSEGMCEKSGGALEVDVSRLKRAIDSKVPRGALLVGHLAPYVVSRKNVEAAVVLRRSPYKLAQVYRKRGYAKKKAAANLGSEILGVTYYDALKNFGGKKTFQLDTTCRTPDETARRIKSVLAGRRPREDRVDWLAEITRKKDLARFFPY